MTKLKNLFVAIFFGTVGFCNSFANWDVSESVDLDSDSRQIDQDYYDHEYLIDLLAYRYNSSLNSFYNSAQFGYRISYGSLDGYSFYRNEELKLKVEEDTFGLGFVSKNQEDFVEKYRSSDFFIFNKFPGFYAQENKDNFKFTLHSNAKFEKKYSDVGLSVAYDLIDLFYFEYRIIDVYAVFNWKEKNKIDTFKRKPWRHFLISQFLMFDLKFSLKAILDTPIEWSLRSRDLNYKNNLFSFHSNLEKNFGRGILNLSFDGIHKKEEFKFEKTTREVESKRRFHKYSLSYLGSTHNDRLSYELGLDVLTRNSPIQLKGETEPSEVFDKWKNLENLNSLRSGRASYAGGWGLVNMGITESNSHVVRLGLSAGKAKYAFTPKNILVAGEENAQVRKETWQSKALSAWEFRFLKNGVFALNVSWDLDNVLRKTFYNEDYDSSWDGGNFQMGVFF
jgi:hypothetical protein